jgi:hypothetical protein
VTTEKINIPEDEPVFLLRGQDQLAHSAVLYYARILRHNDRDEMADEVERFAAKMFHYGQDHGKMPD